MTKIAKYDRLVGKEMRGKEKMNTFEILLEQMGLFVIYLLAGVILIKTKE